MTETNEAAYERGQQLCAQLGDQGWLDVGSVQERDLAGTFPESARRAYDSSGRLSGLGLSGEARKLRAHVRRLQHPLIVLVDVPATCPVWARSGTGL